MTQLEGFARLDARDGFQQQINAFDRAQIGGVKDQHFIAQAEFAAHFLARTLRRARLKKIVDDIDRAVEAEHALGFLLSKMRKRS